MPDQPMSNASRITAMLQDLAAARANPGAVTPPVNLPTRSASPAPATPGPVNPPAPQPKPVAPIPVAPTPTPAPIPQRPITAPTAPTAPMGVVVPPKPTAPPPPPPVKPSPAPIQVTPAVPRPLTPPTPAAPRPAIPTVPATPPKPAQTYTSELRTMKADMGQISTGQAPAGTPSKPAPPVPPTPSAPVPPRPPIPTPAPQIVIPNETEAPTGGIKKGVYIGALAVVILVIGAYYLYLSDNTPTEEVLNSITPSPSESSAPLGKALSVYFSQTSPQTADLKADQSAQDDFLSVYSSTQPTAQQALRIPVTGPFTASLGEFLGGIGLAVPSDLKAALSTDWVVLAYGQSEQFDAQGQIIAGAAINPRLVMISAVQDATAANQAMQSWEANGLASAILDLAGFDKAKASTPTFSDGSYKQIAVRYQNYPYADQSIDYAIALASNGKNYLIISASRESLFYAIDQLVQ